MLHIQAIAAYAIAATLSIGSVVLTILTLTQPWLESRSGNYIYLTKYCLSSGYCTPFPDRAVCKGYPGFCATWKTAVFGLALTIALDLVVGLAVLFSWVAARRKKTAIVVKYLSGVSLVIDLCVLQAFWTIYANEEFFSHGWRWIPHGSFLKLALSTLCLLVIFIEMFFFRGIIKRPDEHDDYDSDDDDDDDDIDTISIGEELSEEDRDFYIFNKQARRLALRGG